MLILGSILDLTLVIPGTIVFLVNFIGWQALMGVICLFFLVPYFAALSSPCATLRRRAAAVSDTRFSLLNQVISGIRAIKTHAWEDEFRGKIKRIRRYVKRCTNWFRSSRERCGKIFLANPGRFIECFLEQLRSTMFKYVLQLKWNETNRSKKISSISFLCDFVSLKEEPAQIYFAPISEGLALPPT